MDMRVFWAVLAALAISGSVVFLSSAFSRYFEQRAFEQALDKVAQASSHAVQESQQRSDEERADVDRRRQILDIQTIQSAKRRVLSANQRCVGGFVIQIDGSTYTQIGSIQHPVHCVGRVADAALR